jgi:hypothetical protein
MDCQPSKGQQDIKKAAREFAEKEFPEVGMACDQSESFPFDFWRKACELGLIGCFVPEEYGGASLAQGALEKAIRYIKERQQFGRPLADFQANRFKITDMWTWPNGFPAGPPCVARMKPCKCTVDTDTWESTMFPGFIAMRRYWRSTREPREVEKELVARTLLKRQF